MRSNTPTKDSISASRDLNFPAWAPTEVVDLYYEECDRELKVLDELETRHSEDPECISYCQEKRELIRRSPTDSDLSQRGMLYRLVTKSEMEAVFAGLKAEGTYVRNPQSTYALLWASVSQLAFLGPIGIDILPKRPRKVLHIKAKKLAKELREIVVQSARIDEFPLVQYQRPYLIQKTLNSAWLKLAGLKDESEPLSVVPSSMAKVLEDFIEHVVKCEAEDMPLLARPGDLEAKLIFFVRKLHDHAQHMFQDPKHAWIRATAITCFGWGNDDLTIERVCKITAPER